MRVFLVILYCCLAVGPFPLTKIGQVFGSSSQLPFDLSKPYALVVGDYGTLFTFDGHQLFPLHTPASFNITEVRWRDDGASALAVGTNDTFLNCTVSNGAVSVDAIPTPFLSHSIS